MKKYFGVTLLMALLALFIASSDLYAQCGKGKGMGQGKGCCSKFVDANGDGKCDNFVDANGDGKCDNCTGNGKCDGNGKCMSHGKGHCSKFVDANGDGKCDNFVDANGDGKCDNCIGNGKCDGNGKCIGQGNGQCGKGMMGQGNGKGNCGKSCKMKGSNQSANFSIGQNIPNPVNGVTKIPFTLKVDNNVKVILYDNSGNEIKNIFDGNLKAGDHEVELNTAGLNPGNYIYSVTVDGKVQSGQIVVVK